MSASNARIAGVGLALPPVVVTSAAIEARLHLEPGWIESRTGVRERRYAEDDVAVSDLARDAGVDAIRDAGLDPADVRLVLLATSTPDYVLPPTAPTVADAVGCRGAGAADVAGACAGFVYALTLAGAHVAVTGAPALVIGANVLSRRLHPNDPTTTPVFADGAGAAVLVPGADGRGILATHLASDGRNATALLVPAGGSRHPVTADAVARDEHLMVLNDGSMVFRRAVRSMVTAGRRALDGAALTVDDVDWWIPHQASGRIIDETGRQLGIDGDRTVRTIATWGNSSAATNPMALAALAASGRLHADDLVLFTAAGAGFVSAAAVVRW